MELVLAAPSGARVDGDRDDAAEPAAGATARDLPLRELRARDRAAALAGARWLGRADQEAAEEAAFSGDARARSSSCRSAAGS